MENGSNAFFSNEESVIARTVDLEDQEKKFGNHRWDQDLPLEEYYEIAETVAQITEHGLKRVSLSHHYLLKLIDYHVDCSTVSR